MNKAKTYRQKIAEEIIAKMKAGTAPWQKPWSTDGVDVAPQNAITGKKYKGINRVNLMMGEFDDNRWVTYKQAKALGAQVRQGEKARVVEYWKFEDKVDAKDENGNVILDKNGKAEQVTVKLEKPMVFLAYVFNAEQIDNMPIQERKPINDKWKPVERAEHILAESGANIQHKAGDEAYYSSKHDKIVLPHKSQFESPEKYYGSALHELGHWTGHESRLDRGLLNNPFGSAEYAKEELRAEISAMLISQDIFLEYNPANHISYVENWIQALEKDHNEIFRACADAEKIKDFILSFEQQQLQVDRQKNTVLVIGGQDHGVTIFKNLDDLIENRNYDPATLGSIKYALENGTLEDALDRLRVGVFDRDKEIIAEVSVDLEKGSSNVKEVFPVDDWFIGTEPKLEEWFEKAEKQVLKAAANFYQDDPEDKNAIDKFDNTFGKILTMEQAKQVDIVDSKIEVATEKTYLKIPYPEKDEAKKLGAKWDREKLSWYAPEGVNLKNFEKWNIASQEEGQNQAIPADGLTKTASKTDVVTEEKTYLNVPYSEKDEAKKLGARWDKEASSWYVEAGMPVDTFKKWGAGSNTKVVEKISSDPKTEFIAFLAQQGCDTSNILMDGKSHRVAVTGDKKGEKSGFYIGHNDGRPAGYFTNNRTGEEIRWKAKNFTVSPNVSKEELLQQAAERKQQREQEQKQLNKTAIEHLTKSFGANYPAVSKDDQFAYVANKQIILDGGVYKTKSNSKIIIPIVNAAGQLQSAQFIDSNSGSKIIAKNTNLEGGMYVVGNDKNALEKAEIIILSEGFATASTIAEAMTGADTKAAGIGSVKIASIAAFSSNNIKVVAEELHKKYPDKEFIIAGDDDFKTELKLGKNPGKEKAAEAAAAIGAKVVFPIFAPGEREELKYSDFNDLIKSKVGNGISAVKEQLFKAVKEVMPEKKQEEVQAKKDRVAKPKPKPKTARKGVRM